MSKVEKWASREVREGNNGGTRKIIWKIIKKVWAWLGGVLLVWLAVWVVDKDQSKRRKSADTAEFWQMDVQRDSTKAPDSIRYAQLKDTNWNGKLDKDDEDILSYIGLDELVEENRWMLCEGFGIHNLQWVMTGENDLKTKNEKWKRRQKFDDETMHWKWWIERSKSSKSVIWKLIWLKSTWSYWPFQVQREAIDKYEKIVISRYTDNEQISLYDKICNDIANFRIPNTEWKYEELYKQLGYKNIDDMVKDIKKHKLDMYKWWWRVWIAYGIVLINEIYREINEPIEDFDKDEWYEIINASVDKIEKNDDEVKKAIQMSNENTQFRNKLVTWYLLNENGPVNFSYIDKVYRSTEFQNWAVSALWCTDNIKSNKICKYLFYMQLRENNEFFDHNIFVEWEHPDWDRDMGKLDIKVPTGNFGNKSIGLANKIFGKNFTAAEDAIAFLDTQDMDNFWKEQIDRFIKNRRRCFVLWSNNKNTKTWLEVNSKQEKLLQEDIDLAFNNRYIAVKVLEKFVDENVTNDWKKEKIKADIRDMWNNYSKKQMQTSDYENGVYTIDELKKIMTNKEKFCEFTWLGVKDKGDGNKEYNDWAYRKFVKDYLIPALIWNTVMMGETGLIIPEIQSNPWGSTTWNEQNSIARFEIWAKYGNQKMIPHVVNFDKRYQLDWLEAMKLGTNGEEKEALHLDSMEYLKWALFNNTTVRKYLESHCITKNWDKITDFYSIPDELVSEIVRNEYGEYFDVETIKTWDNINFKIDWATVYKYFDNLWTAVKSEVKQVKKWKKIVPIEIEKVLCVDNENGTYKIKKDARLQDILSYYMKNDAGVRKEIIRLNGGVKPEFGKIPFDVIKRIATDEHWIPVNPNRIEAGQLLRFRMQLNNIWIKS